MAKAREPTRSEKRLGDCLLSPGEVIRDRWSVGAKLGSGGFGMVYEVFDLAPRESPRNSPPLRMAMKVEPNNTHMQVLKMEIAVLKKLTGSPHVCQLVAFGRNERMNYVIMSLVGLNLSELRKCQPRGRFSISTALRLGMQMLAALEELHSVGFIHRDVKPSNFAMGLGQQSRCCFMLDFGLSRRYLDDNFVQREPRAGHVGFRGTVRYASMNAHVNRELGPHDDIWSLFYVVCEFVHGGLPWRKLKDKGEVAQYKLQYDHKLLLKGLPGEFNKFLGHVDTLDYFTPPDYAKLQRVFRSAMERLGLQQDEPYDWEKTASPAELSVTTTLSPAQAVAEPISQGDSQCLLRCVAAEEIVVAEQQPQSDEDFSNALLKPRATASASKSKESPPLPAALLSLSASEPNAAGQPLEGLVGGQIEEPTPKCVGDTENSSSAHSEPPSGKLCPGKQKLIGRQPVANFMLSLSTSESSAADHNKSAAEEVREPSPKRARGNGHPVPDNRESSHALEEEPLHQPNIDSDDSQRLPRATSVQPGTDASGVLTRGLSSSSMSSSCASLDQGVAHSFDICQGGAGSELRDFQNLQRTNSLDHDLYNLDIAAKDAIENSSTGCHINEGLLKKLNDGNEGGVPFGIPNDCPTGNLPLSLEAVSTPDDVFSHNHYSTFDPGIQDTLPLPQPPNSVQDMASRRMMLLRKKRFSKAASGAISLWVKSTRDHLYPIVEHTKLGACPCPPSDANAAAH